MKTEKIYTRHEENMEWLNSLSFYTDEIKIMQTRLGEIASKNNSKDVLPAVEHFQNQLIVQKDHIDTLKHKINISNDAISTELKENPTAADRRTMEDHTDIREGMLTFEFMFASLKKEFNTFLSKWM
jgi:hypothetical protein